MDDHIKGLVGGVIGIVIGFILVFYLVGGLSGTLVAAAGQISNSGLPLASLFSSTGAVFVIFMIFLFVALIYLAWRMATHKND